MILHRRGLAVKGFVQGVGFRPFIFKLAAEYQLTGWVMNTSDGVEIEVQGKLEAIEQFIREATENPPNIARIIDVFVTGKAVCEEDGFVIRPSKASESHFPMILPDIATCDECLREIYDPCNRRYRYPFTNCTNCGPRFSIIEKVPYDRKNTTMKSFSMCTTCYMEYNNPEDRRFHAQPNACPACGPHLELWDTAGNVLSRNEEALREACSLIKEGNILAVKGLGGFHLMADASRDAIVCKLRERKKRPHKPFALMYPDIQTVKENCILSQQEEQLLVANEAPIIIVKADSSPSDQIAPANPYLGIMLPYTPLHHLMMNELQTPIIATSGNRSNEPICIDEKEALIDLQGIADYFLVHNRPIEHRVDDSIVRVMAGKKVIIRRSRGYASVPIFMKRFLPDAIALGGQQKSTIAVSRGNMVTISQHLGDLETQKACEHFSSEIEKMMNIYSLKPEIVISDGHPDYFSTKHASTLQVPIKHCQHHHAHIYSCILETEIEPPALGVTWDGTGYGDDGTVWGGEFFCVDNDYAMSRVASLHPFRLLCGEKAVKEPRLVALSLLYEVLGSNLFSRRDIPIVGTFSYQEIVNYEKMLTRGFLSPVCSSMGRLFDGVASLLDLCHEATFEGQASMALEFLAEESDASDSYDFLFTEEILDWRPMIRLILADIEKSVKKSDIAAKFHHTLVDMIATVAEKKNQRQIILSGGVFQNKILVENAVSKLTIQGFTVFTHEQIPPNDGGISCGQLLLLHRS